MRIKSILWLIVLFGPAVFTASIPSSVSVGAGARFALVLIDADGLACPPCLTPLQAFCLAVPPDIQEERVVGVLTYRDGKTTDPRRARIARTRWTGYSRANGIRFPVTVDEAHAFNRLSEEGMTVFLIDPSAGIMKQWTAPFRPDILAEMARFLIVRQTAMMEELR